MQIRLTAKCNNRRKHTFTYPREESSKLHCWAAFRLCPEYLYKKFPDLFFPCRSRPQAERSSIPSPRIDTLYHCRISTPRHEPRYCMGMLHPPVWKSLEPDHRNWGFPLHIPGPLLSPPRRQCSEFVRNHSWRLAPSHSPLAPNGLTESDQVPNGLIKNFK